MTLRAVAAIGILFTLVTLAGVVVGARVVSSDAAGGQLTATTPTQPAPVDGRVTSEPSETTATPEPAPLAFLDVTASPATPRAGEPYELSVTVQNVGAENLFLLLDVESYVEVAADDWKKDPQRVKEGVSLDAGATRTYTFGMESREPGPHVVHVGAFTPGWGETIVFQEAALLMTVAATE